MKIFSIVIICSILSLCYYSNAKSVTSCRNLLDSLQENVDDIFVQGDLSCTGASNWPSFINIQSNAKIAGDPFGGSRLALPPNTTLVFDRNSTLHIKDLILIVSSIEVALGLDFLQLNHGSEAILQNVIFSSDQCTRVRTFESQQVLELSDSIVSNSVGEAVVKICKAFYVCHKDGHLPDFVIDSFIKEDCCLHCFRALDKTERSCPESFFDKLPLEAVIAAVIILGLILVVFVLILALLLNKYTPAKGSKKVLPKSATSGLVEMHYYSHEENIESQESKLRSSENPDLQTRTLTNRNFSLSDVEIKEPLGRGSFGRVYKGHWQGTDVAVKCIVHGRSFLEAGNEPFEAYLSRHVSHPNVVQTFIIHTVPRGGNRDVSLTESIESSFSEMASSEVYNRNLMMSTDDVFGSLAKGTGAHDQDSLETWIVLEFCDRGSLSNAVKDGCFKLSTNSGTRPKIVSAILTALDIANAMMYLHNIRIVHGDLKAENVLLKSDVVDPRGFVCKVSDFGLSRFLAEDTHIETFTYGTITHMPPELLRGGILTPAADVYSFAVLLWELLTGVRPFEGKTHGEIVLLVVNREKRPQIPDYCPDGYAELLEDCWRQSHLERPGFPEVVDRLKELLLEEQEKQTSEFNKNSNSGSNSGFSSPVYSMQSCSDEHINEQSEIVPDNEVSSMPGYYRKSC
eukprot:g6952.t1